MNNKPDNIVAEKIVEELLKKQLLSEDKKEEWYVLQIWTVAKILEKAKFVPANKFKLFDATIKKDYTTPDQEIVIQNGDGFLALSCGLTPVA